MNLHRLQVEHDLRIIILKLRQRFLSASQKPQELSTILGESVSSVRTLLRHALIAINEEPPAAPHDLFKRIAALCGLQTANSLDRAWSARDTLLPADETCGTYGAYLTTLEQVIHCLDSHVPKHEWQRRSAK
jgi:hypothetical protein